MVYEMAAFIERERLGRKFWGVKADGLPYYGLEIRHGGAQKSFGLHRMRR